jgi:hypothetical protein
MLNLLLLGVSLAPPTLAWVFPRISFIGPVLVVAGFLILIISSLASTFKRNKYGPAAQWIEPSKFFAMRFTERELWVFKLSGCVALGGMLAIGVLLLKTWLQ